MVTEQIDKAKNKSRDELLNRADCEKDPDTRLNLVLRYHPALSRRVHTIIRDHHVILRGYNEEHKNVFKDLPRVTYRRAKNIKDSLVRATLPNLSKDVDAGSMKCNGKRCQICPMINETNTFSNRNGTRTYDIRKGPCDCNSDHVIYLLRCRTCGIQYVGSAKTALRLRINNYKKEYRKYVRLCESGEMHSSRKGLQSGVRGRGGEVQTVSQINLHAHFAQPDHKGLEDFEFTIIGAGKNLEEIRDKEHWWQHKLGVFEPHGLNEKEVSKY